MNDAKTAAMVQDVIDEATKKILKIFSARNGGGAAGKNRSGEKRRSVKRRSPTPDTNLGRIYDYLMRRVGKEVMSKELEKLLKTRREAGPRVSGDAASVSSNINHLKKLYRLDIERVAVGLYKLNPGKRRAN